MKKAIAVTSAIWVLGFSVLADEKPEETPAKEPALRSELLRRTKADQEARNRMIKWMKRRKSTDIAEPSKLSPEKNVPFERLAAEAKEIDTQNMKWLKGIVAKHGWPTFSLVGEDGANATWLLVQHADAEPKFQRLCLDLMAKLPKDEVSQSDFAYLTDRVLLAEGRKQVYGTQFLFIEGKLEPRPIEDEANVDRRRAENGRIASVVVGFS